MCFYMDFLGKVFTDAFVFIMFVDCHMEFNFCSNNQPYWMIPCLTLHGFHGGGFQGGRIVHPGNRCLRFYKFR